MAMNLPNYERYEDLRRGLEVVQRGFERAAISWPNLTHRLFHAPNEAMSQEAWQTFAKMNKNKTEGAAWELWLPFPSGNYCNQFVGEEKWFRVLDKLADSAMEVLDQLSWFKQQNGDIPENASFNLPEDTGLSGWIKLVYETAYFSTALLRSNFSAWEVPDEISADELDGLMYDAWSEPIQGGLRIPLHPPVEELHLDLFNSSLEAILCWLFPEQVVNLWNYTDELPISLPSTVDEEWEEEFDDSESITNQIKSAIKNLIERPKPRYDRDERTLYVGNIEVKRFKNKAKYQVPLLIGFEEAGWPKRIDDPLPFEPGDEVAIKRRLHVTICSLNEGLDNKSIIHFHGDGTGQGVVWEYVDERSRQTADTKEPLPPLPPPTVSL